MLKHRGGVLTQYGAAIPLCPSGYSGMGAGTARSVVSALELLAVALAMPSEFRLASDPMARVTRLAPPL
jgi:hypothetical protein